MGKKVDFVEWDWWDECATCYTLPATEAIGFLEPRRIAPYP